MVVVESGPRARDVHPHVGGGAVRGHADPRRRRPRPRQYPGPGRHRGGDDVAAGGGALRHLPGRTVDERVAARRGDPQHLPVRDLAGDDRLPRGDRHHARPPIRGGAPPRGEGADRGRPWRPEARDVEHGPRGDPPVRGSRHRPRSHGAAQHPRMGHQSDDARGLGRHRHQRPRRLCQELPGRDRPRPDELPGSDARGGARGPRTQQREHRRGLHRQERRAAVHPWPGPPRGRRRHRAGRRPQPGGGRAGADPKHRPRLHRAVDPAGGGDARRPWRGGDGDGDDGPGGKQPPRRRRSEGEARGDPADAAAGGRDRHRL